MLAKANWTSMWYHRYYEHATVRLQHGLTYSIVLLKMLQLGPLKHSSLTKLYLMGKWRRVFEWILNDEQNWEPQNLRGHFHGYPAFPIAQNMSWHQRSPTRAPIIITAQCPTFHFGDSTATCPLASSIKTNKISIPYIYLLPYIFLETIIPYTLMKTVVVVSATLISR